MFQPVRLILESYLALRLVPRLLPPVVIHVTLIIGFNVFMVILLSVTTMHTRPSMRWNAIAWQVHSIVSNLVAPCLVLRPHLLMATPAQESFIPTVFRYRSIAHMENYVALAKAALASRTRIVRVTMEP